MVLLSNVSSSAVKALSKKVALRKCNEPYGMQWLSWVFNCLVKFWQGQAKSREEMEWFSKTLNCEGQVQWGAASAR